MVDEQGEVGRWAALMAGAWGVMVGWVHRCPASLLADLHPSSIDPLCQEALHLGKENRDLSRG